MGKATFINQIFIRVIQIYQYLTQGRRHFCKFIPSCSSYALGAYTHFGFLRASRLMLSRFVRCLPFLRGGYDPLPYQ